LEREDNNIQSELDYKTGSFHNNGIILYNANCMK